MSFRILTAKTARPLGRWQMDATLKKYGTAQHSQTFAAE
jgi:hypothetical protein